MTWRTIFTIVSITTLFARLHGGDASPLTFGDIADIKNVVSSIRGGLEVSEAKKLLRQYKTITPLPTKLPRQDIYFREHKGFVITFTVFYNDKNFVSMPVESFEIRDGNKGESISVLISPKVRESPVTPGEFLK